MACIGTLFTGGLAEGMEAISYEARVENAVRDATWQENAWRSWMGYTNA